MKFEWFMSLARPAIGARPIVEITSLEILAVLRPIEARGRLETAKKLRGAIGQVFRFAVATGRAENDPTGALKGALASPTVQHRAAIIEPKAFGGLLRAIAGYEGGAETLAALQLLPLTLVRPGELRAAEWAEFDLGRGRLGDTGGKNENAPAASRPAGAASHRDTARPSSHNRPRKVPFSVRPHADPLHERKHHQRGLAPARLPKGRNERAWFPLVRIFDAERIGPLERRRHRTPAGACRQ